MLTLVVSGLLLAGAAFHFWRQQARESSEDDVIETFSTIGMRPVDSSSSPPVNPSAHPAPLGTSSSSPVRRATDGDTQQPAPSNPCACLSVAEEQQCNNGLAENFNEAAKKGTKCLQHGDNSELVWCYISPQCDKPYAMPSDASTCKWKFATWFDCNGNTLGAPLDPTTDLPVDNDALDTAVCFFDAQTIVNDLGMLGLTMQQFSLAATEPDAEPTAQDWAGLSMDLLAGTCQSMAYMVFVLNDCRLGLPPIVDNVCAFDALEMISQMAAITSFGMSSMWTDCDPNYVPPEDERRLHRVHGNSSKEKSPGSPSSRLSQSVWAERQKRRLQVERASVERVDASDENSTDSRRLVSAVLIRTSQVQRAALTQQQTRARLTGPNVQQLIPFTTTPNPGIRQGAIAACVFNVNGLVSAVGLVGAIAATLGDACNGAATSDEKTDCAMNILDMVNNMAGIVGTIVGAMSLCPVEPAAPENQLNCAGGISGLLSALTVFSIDADGFRHDCEGMAGPGGAEVAKGG
jgi:hypothetical protein